VVLAVWDQRRWRALCELLSLPQLSTDPKLATNADRLAQYERLRPQLQRQIGSWRTTELVERLVAAEIPCSQTYDIAQASADPHIREVGALYAEDRFGVPLMMVANPLVIDGGRAPRNRPPPHLGEHTREVLAEVLQLDGVALDALERAGAVAAHAGSGAVA
jgi:crotonobetainyl-CoA:carnitine CoA-transferase CaiB-like acyl-CoA transferase